MVLGDIYRSNGKHIFKDHDVFLGDNFEDVARAHEDAELGERWPVEAQPRGLMLPSVGVGYQE